GHVIIAAGLEAEYGVSLGVECRQHDDRHHVAAGAPRPADLIPVRTGTQGDVEQHDVEVVRAGAVDRLTAAGDSRDVMTLARKRAGQHLTQIRLVVNDEDAQRPLALSCSVAGQLAGTLCDHSATIVAIASSFSTICGSPTRPSTATAHNMTSQVM